MIAACLKSKGVLPHDTREQDKSTGWVDGEWMVSGWWVDGGWMVGGGVISGFLSLFPPPSSFLGVGVRVCVRECGRVILCTPTLTLYTTSPEPN
jgi:hypothetical protein